MKTLIIYDSVYGNTEKIANVIAQACQSEAPHLRGEGWREEGQDEVILKKVSEAKADDLEGIGLLIVGSPTHGGRATPAIQNFLKNIPNGILKDAKVAAFDTRFDENKQKGFLKLLSKIIKFAAPKITNALKIKGVEMAIEPMGFIVEGKEGPLKQGELERAALWVKSLLR